MSFRKKTLTKPNIAGLRKKPISISNTNEIQDKIPIPNKDDSEKSCGKSEGPETSSKTATTAINVAPVLGTKLAKRVKPKVNIKSAISRNQDKDELNENTPQSSLTKSENLDTGQILPETNQPTNIEENNLGLTGSSIGDSQILTNEAAPSEIQQKPQIEKKPDSKRLSKRLKVNPKIVNTRRPLSNSAQPKDVTKEIEEKSQENVKKSKMEPSEDLPDSQDNVNDSGDVQEEQNSKDANLPASTSTESKASNISKLQKRKKIMPNLSIPSKAKSQVGDSAKIAEVTESVNTQKQNVSKAQNCENPSIDATDTSEINKKHVRFEPAEGKQFIDDKGLSRIPEEESLRTSNSPLTPGTGAQPKPSILKKDTYDYSSQSEGEMSHSTSLSKGKKVFKPNLGARRRKRLSSFSAYSSCDDDEDDSRSDHVEKKRPNKTSHIDNEEKMENARSPRKENAENETETAASGKKRKSKKKKKEKENEDKESSESEELEIVKPLKKRTRKNRKICTEERDISTLTMQELIFYRPKSLQKVELRANKLENEVEETATLMPDETQDQLEVKGKKEEIGDDEDESIAPQVMLNENGEVVINNESLTIRKKVDDSHLKRTDILYENALSNNNHRRKVSRVKRWKMNETLRFYKALSQIGTDFTLMSQAFGRFTRNELKKKFKQEEKINCDLVDMALSNRLPLNMEMFLRGKEEMQEILDEEIKALSGIVENDKKDSKKSDKVLKKETPKESVSVDDLPDCHVEIERTKIDTTVSKLSNTDSNDEEGSETFTDFKKTDGKKVESSTTTTITTPATRLDDTTNQGTKSRRLRIISDDEDDSSSG